MHVAAAHVQFSSTTQTKYSKSENKHENKLLTYYVKALHTLRKTGFYE